MAFVVDVFLSSTFEDLRAYSDAVYQRLNKHEMFRCTHQRDFGARDATAVEYCRDRVLKAELYVGIIGMRRGWEPKGDSDKRSITEMEHDWAKGAPKPRFLYVSPAGFPVPGDKPESMAMHRRQLAFRKRLMGQGERVVSQSGFESPDLLAAEIHSTLISYVATGELIKRFRSDLAVPSPTSPEERRPAIAAAVERLAEDHDVDLLAIARTPNNVDLVDLESKLKARAEAHEAKGRSALKTSAEYWRHIGALAFLHDTRNALAAYERAVSLDPSEPEGWRYLGELQYRLGEVGKAEQSFTRLVEIGKSTSDPPTQAMGCMRLAWIVLRTGDLTKAEALINDALRLAVSAGWLEGVARAYGNLGNIYQTRGDLDKAEQILRRALALFEEQGNNEGMANSYGNLGNIHLIRGDLDKAEEMQHKALALVEKLGRKEGMAITYTSLGIIHWTRGDLDKAEELQRKVLALSKELGNKQGMATAHLNLGRIYEKRDDLDKAEQMQRKALALSTELGRKQGMAAALWNLGVIHKRRGAKADMCDCCQKARDLYREMGLSKEVAEAEEWLKQERCGES